MEHLIVSLRHWEVNLLLLKHHSVSRPDRASDYYNSVARQSQLPQYNGKICNFSYNEIKIILNFEELYNVPM